MEVWQFSDNFLNLVEEIDFFERGGGAISYFFFKNLFWPTFILPHWVRFKFWFGVKIFHTFLQTLNGLLTLRYPNTKACRHGQICNRIRLMPSSWERQRFEVVFNLVESSIFKSCCCVLSNCTPREWWP